MHKNIALNLIKDNIVDEIIYVPTGNKYQKNELIDAKYRFEMLNIMTKKYNNLSVSDYELKNKQIYTYQTLDYFKKENNFIYLIIGSDNYNDIINWKNYNYIINNYKIIVINRNNDHIVSHNNILVYNIEKNNISSTKIRKNVEKYDLDKDILNYIKLKKLYNI